MWLKVDELIYRPSGQALRPRASSGRNFPFFIRPQVVKLRPSVFLSDFFGPTPPRATGGLRPIFLVFHALLGVQAKCFSLVFSAQTHHPNRGMISGLCSGSCLASENQTVPNTSIALSSLEQKKNSSLWKERHARIRSLLVQTLKYFEMINCTDLDVYWFYRKYNSPCAHILHI
jgi:hypothetical protein